MGAAERGRRLGGRGGLPEGCRAPAAAAGTAADPLPSRSAPGAPLGAVFMPEPPGGTGRDGAERGGEGAVEHGAPPRVAGGRPGSRRCRPLRSSAALLSLCDSVFLQTFPTYRP